MEMIVKITWRATCFGIATIIRFIYNTLIMIGSSFCIHNYCIQYTERHFYFSGNYWNQRSDVVIIENTIYSQNERI
jgi:acetyltransferase-like isoleucine patch superfamily enzyme